MWVYSYLEVIVFFAYFFFDNAVYCDSAGFQSVVLNLDGLFWDYDYLVFVDSAWATHVHLAYQRVRLFQSFLLIPSLTALENVTLPAILRGEGEDIEKAKQLLHSVGLSGRETHLPAQLSGGEQQRVALARAFMTQPEILFADEPTGNLDQHTAENIIDLLFALNKNHGTTLLLVTHDPALAKRCSRVLAIKAGRLQEALW